MKTFSLVTLLILSSSTLSYAGVCSDQNALEAVRAAKAVITQKWNTKLLKSANSIGIGECYTHHFDDLLGFPSTEEARTPQCGVSLGFESKEAELKFARELKANLDRNPQYWLNFGFIRMNANNLDTAWKIYRNYVPFCTRVSGRIVAQ